MPRMSAGDTRTLIQQAVERFGVEVPALKQLRVVLKLELPARGADAPVWRVELPGPRVSRDPAGDARVDISVQLSRFNELARDGRLRDWVDAAHRGQGTIYGEAEKAETAANATEHNLPR